MPRRYALSEAAQANVNALAWQLAAEYRDKLKLSTPVYERLAWALDESLSESVSTTAATFTLLLGALTPEQLNALPDQLKP
jgi:hypothetical protein